MNVHLLNPTQAILTISIQGYQQLFEDIKSRKWIIRLVYGIYQCLHPGILSTLMVACYGAKSFLTVRLSHPPSTIIMTATTTNEIKHAHFFANAVGQDNVTIARSSLKNLLHPHTIYRLGQCIIHWRIVVRYIRIIGYINRKHGFMPTCRTASMFGYYMYFRTCLARSKPKAIAVVSDYSPDGLGLIYAAQHLHIRTIYMTHAFLPHHSKAIPQNFDLAFFDGQISLQNYRSLSDRFQGKAALMGLDSEYQPMRLETLADRGMSVGMFLTAPANVPQIKQCVEHIQQTWQPAHILIRPHPEPLTHSDFSPITQAHDNVTIAIGSTLLEDVEQCDMGVVGNSSATLEIVKAGLPCVYYGGLEGSPYDYCRFVATNLVPEAKHHQLPAITTITQHYQHDRWSETFRQYDPYFDQTTTKSDIIRQEVLQLLDIQE